MVEFFSYFYRYSYCACINTTKILGIHRRGTVLRFRNNRTVTRFTFSGQGIQTAIWRSGTQSPENGGGIQGGYFPSWHTTFAESLVSNPKFAAMMQEKINMKVDTAAIDQEIANYEKQLRQSYSIKSKLMEEIDSLDPDDRHYIKRKADLDDRLY